MRNLNYRMIVYYIKKLFIKKIPGEKFDKIFINRNDSNTIIVNL